ncbi:Rab family GTPase YPT6 [Pelomyxa schiedti]|nr:Rab family GTPase YPT6 [Pelomyxa schiedti]
MLNGAYSGKTSAGRRYTDNEFLAVEHITIGCDFFLRDLLLRGYCARLQVWDTPGIERAYSLVRNVSRDAQVCIIMYSVSDRGDGLENIETTAESVKAASPLVRLIVCGNKADLPRKVTREEGYHIAQLVGADIWMETSAKTGHNIGKLFFLAALHSLQSIQDSLLTTSEHSESNPTPPTTRKIAEPWTSLQIPPINEVAI